MIHVINYSTKERYILICLKISDYFRTDNIIGMEICKQFCILLNPKPGIFIELVRVWRWIKALG